MGALVTTFDKFESFGGTDGLLGEAGRLTNALVIGGMGVLAGRSSGKKSLIEGTLGSGSLAKRSRLLPSPLIIPVGTDGRLNMGFSFNSSIGGNVWENPVMSRFFIFSRRGEEEGDDDGDGGPNVDGDTMVCCDEVEEMGVGGDKVDNNARVEDAEDEVEIRFGERGEGGKFDESRDMRFVLTTMPRSCSARTRSWMLGRGLGAGCSSLLSLFAMTGIYHDDGLTYIEGFSKFASFSSIRTTRAFKSTAYFCTED